MAFEKCTNECAHWLNSKMQYRHPFSTWPILLYVHCILHTIKSALYLISCNNHPIVTKPQKDTHFDCWSVSDWGVNAGFCCLPGTSRYVWFSALANFNVLKFLRWRGWDNQRCEIVHNLHDEISALNRNDIQNFMAAGEDIGSFSLSSVPSVPSLCPS